MRRQLWSEPANAEKDLRVAWIGGVFNSRLLLERFRMLVELEGSVTTAAPLHGPAIGALLIAAKLAGHKALYFSA